MVVHMAGRSRLVVDVKTPLTATEALEGPHNEEAGFSKSKAKAKVENRVRPMASQPTYLAHFERSPECILLSTGDQSRLRRWPERTRLLETDIQEDVEHQQTHQN